MFTVLIQVLSNFTSLYKSESERYILNHFNSIQFSLTRFFENCTLIVSALQFVCNFLKWSWLVWSIKGYNKRNKFVWRKLNKIKQAQVENTLKCCCCCLLVYTLAREGETDLLLHVGIENSGYNSLLSIKWACLLAQTHSTCTCKQALRFNFDQNHNCVIWNSNLSHSLSLDW